MLFNCSILFVLDWVNMLPVSGLSGPSKLEMLFIPVKENNYNLVPTI